MKGSLNLIFKHQAQEVFDSFTRLLDIRIVFFDAEGKEFNAGDNKDICEYCLMLRNELSCGRFCNQWDRKNQIKARQTGRLNVYKCYSGMTEAVMPVITEDELIGFIMIGQFRTSDKFALPPQIQKISQQREKLLKTAYFRAPFYEESKVAEIVQLFSVLVNFIVSHHLIAVKNEDPVKIILEYIRRNPLSNLTPSQAAKMVFRSESSISHLFKRATAMGIVEYQIEKKLCRGEEIIRENPDIQIKKAAAMAGFSDPLYFSRLYKRKRGFSPSQFRQAAKQNCV
jgi:ligand-binding sensor protein/AraC-like DNA-binding protein